VPAGGGGSGTRGNVVGADVVVVVVDVDVVVVDVLLGGIDVEVVLDAGGAGALLVVRSDEVVVVVLVAAGVGVLDDCCVSSGTVWLASVSVLQPVTPTTATTTVKIKARTVRT
jgi:hypothetical protein